MNEIWASILPLILPLSLGSIGGFFLGYAVKKVYKLAIIIGLFIFSIVYLAYINIINLNIGEVETVLAFIANIGPFIVASLTSSLLFMGSFAIGLVSGFKKG